MEKKTVKSYIFLITYAIALFLLLTHLNDISIIFTTSISLTTPFILGFVIAYLLNGPLNFFETKVYTFKTEGKPPVFNSLKKVLSLVSVYVSFFFIIILLSSIIIPQLATSINTLVKDIPNQYNSFKPFLQNLFTQLDGFDLDYNIWNQFEKTWNDALKFTANFLSTALPQIMVVIMGITESVSNLFIGFIISVYLLSGKDKLIIQVKKLLNAFLPTKVVKKLLYIGALTHKTFSGFITGQITDAFILGTLCFIGMSIFKMPYALLVSVIIGLTNVIPIFGPILGAIPSTFIILMAEPTQPMNAVWFIIFIVVLQQIDGNIIYPRIVGNSIGLSGLWVMFAILVGGSKFGLIGMVLGVPTFAVAYALIREITYYNLKIKEKTEGIYMHVEENASLLELDKNSSNIKVPTRKKTSIPSSNKES